MKRLVLFFFLICSFAFAEIKETYIPKLKWKTNVKGDVISIYETNNNLAVLTRYHFVHHFVTGNTEGYIYRVYVVDKDTGNVKMKFTNKTGFWGSLNLYGDGSKIYFIGKNTADLGIMQLNVGVASYLYSIDIDKAVVEWKMKIKSNTVVLGKIQNTLVIKNSEGIQGIDLNKKTIAYKIVGFPLSFNNLEKGNVIDWESGVACCVLEDGKGENRRIVRVDLKTGEIIWEKPLQKKENYLILAYDKDFVYLLVWEGFFKIKREKVIALDMKTGIEKFSVNISISPYLFVKVFDFSNNGCYMIDDNKEYIFIASVKPEKAIYAISKKDGEISWKIPWKKKNQFIVSDENLCVFQKKQVKFYDSRNGQFMWSFDTDEKVSDPKLFEIEDTIVLIPNNRFIYLLDKKTGQISNKLADKGKIVSSYYSNNKLFVVFKKLGKVICCEYELPSFNLIWEKEFSTIFKDVIWYGEKNNLYVVWGKNIFWFDLITGKLLSSFKCDGGFVSAHVSEGDSTKILYVNTKKLLKVSKSGTILSKYILEKSN